MSKRKEPAAAPAQTTQAQQDFAAWVERKEAVVLVLDFAEAWGAMTAIQVATAREGALGPLHEYAKEVGAKVQRLVSKTPALAAMAAAGWQNGDGGGE
jgi:hypothetical protein